MDTDLANGMQWMRAVLKCYCRRSTQTEACLGVQDVLAHIHSTPANRCQDSCPCSSLRQLQRHFAQCQSHVCPLCTPLREEAIFGADTHAAAAAAAAAAVEPELSVCSDGEDDGSSGWDSDDDADAGRSGAEDVADAALDEPAASAAADNACLQATSANSLQGLAAGIGAAPPVLGGPGSDSDSSAQVLLHFACALLHSLLGTPQAHLGVARQPGSWLAAGRQLWEHLLGECSRSEVTGACAYPGCQQARRVLLHLLTCQGPTCALCGPLALRFTPGCPDMLLAVAQPHRQLSHPDSFCSEVEWLQAVDAASRQLGL